MIMNCAVWCFLLSLTMFSSIIDLDKMARTRNYVNRGDTGNPIGPAF